MEEQVLTVKKKRRSRRPLVLAIVAIIIIAAIGYALLPKGPSSDPAGYIPKEVALAATVDLTRTADKDAAMDAIRGIFKDAGVDKPDQELFKEIKKDLNLDVEKDIIPHLTGKGAMAALTEMNGMMPMMVAVVGARSDSDASDLMEKIKTVLKDNKIASQKLSYKGCDYIQIREQSNPSEMSFGAPKMVHYVGAVKSAVVWANGEAAFQKVVDTANGQPSLLSDPEFTRRVQTNPGTFATVFVSGPGYFKLLSPMMNMSMGMMNGEVPPQLKEQMDNFVAAAGTAEASKDGLLFKATGETKKDEMHLTSVRTDDLAAKFPADAKVAISVGNWQKCWEQMKKSYLANPMVKGEVDKWVMQSKQMMGFDPLADLLDHITGWDAYYIPDKQVTSAEIPGAVSLVVTVDKPDVVKDSIGKLVTFASLSGAAKVGKTMAEGQEITSITMGPGDETVCLSMIDNKLVITYTDGSDGVKAAVASVIAAQGKGANLTQSQGYKLVKSKLPEKTVGFIYGDIGGIVDACADSIPEPDRKKVEAVFEHVGVFASAGDTNGTESTSVAFIPLRK